MDLLGFNFFDSCIHSPLLLGNNFFYIVKFVIIKRIKVFQTKWQFFDFVVLWWKPLPPENMFSILR